MHDTFTHWQLHRESSGIAIATLDRLHRDGLDAATLQSARNYIAWQFAPSMETAPQLASAIAWLALYGDSRDYIDGYLGQVASATPAQVERYRAYAPRLAPRRGLTRLLWRRAWG